MIELGDNLPPDAKMNGEVENETVNAGETRQARDLTLVLGEKALRIANLSGQLGP